MRIWLMSCLVIAAVAAACSRHEPEQDTARAGRAAPPARAAAAHRRRVSARRATHQPAWIEGQVVDGATQGALAGVEVCIMWVEQGQLRQRLLQTGGDGQFRYDARAVTSDVVMAAARHAGYLPTAATWAGAPLRLVLTRGDTVPVSGVLRDEQGQPVAGARIAIRTTNLRQWYRCHALLGSCETVTDDGGHFVHAGVPAGLTWLFPQVWHPQFPVHDLTNVIYHTTHGAVALDLTITRGVSVTGCVRLASGGAVVGARVWAEYLPNGVLEEWHRTALAPAYELAYAAAHTTPDGTFALGRIPRGQPFIVKAAQAGLPTACAGPFVPDALPRMIELVIDDGEPRLIGVLRDTRQQPVTNAHLYVRTCVPIIRGAVRWQQNEVELDISADGKYLSQPLAPGEHLVQWEAPGLQPVSRQITLAPGEHALHDVTFQSQPWQIVTGLVIDAHTHQPLEGVAIRVNKGAPGDCSTVSDRNGQFWLSTAGASFTCTLAGYLPESACYLRDPLVVFMSRACEVQVEVRRADGSPCRYGVVQLTPQAWAPVHDGTCVISNVPTRYERLVPEFRDQDGGRIIATGEPFSPEAGKVHHVRITLPDAGTLCLRFDRPVAPREVRICAWTANNYCLAENCFEHCGAEYFASDVEAGTARIEIDLPGWISYTTSVVIQASVTTTVAVALDEIARATGRVWGSARCDDGQPLKGTVFAYARAPIDYAAHSRGEFADLKDGQFTLFGLVTNVPYDVEFRIMGSHVTSIWMRAVMPNSGPLEVVLPRGVTVHGTIVNAQGQPVPCTVYLNHQLLGAFDGDISIFPVGPGSHILTIELQNQLRFEHRFVVQHADVDLGLIQIPNAWVSVRGRIVDADGKPVIGAQVYVAPADQPNEKRLTESGHAGLFTTTGLPRGRPLMLGAYAQRPQRHARLVLDPVWDDVVDVGEVVLVPEVVLFTVKNADGTPAAGCFVNGIQLDNDGTITLPLTEVGERFRFTRSAPFAGMTTSQYYLVYVRPGCVQVTNTVHVTLPKWLVE